MEKIKIDKESISIVKNYKKINRFFFNYFFYILLLFVSIGIISIYTFEDKLIFKEDTKQKNTMGVALNSGGNKIYGDMVYDASNVKIQGVDLTLNLIKGFFILTGDTIFVKDTFIKLKGYTLPYDSFFNVGVELGKFSDLETGNYDKTILDNYMTKILKSDVSAVRMSYQPKNNVLKQLEGNLISKTFVLGCLESVNLVDSFCKVNLEKMISNMYLYDVHKDIKGLKLAYKGAKDMNIKDQFCKGLLQNYYYSFNVDGSSEEILKDCGGDYYKKYSELLKFKYVQDEITKEAFTDSLLGEQSLNSYKLVSMMRMIVINKNKGLLNYDVMFKYLDFVKNLLKNQNSIENGYFELVYYYNQSILKPYLDELEKDQSQATLQNRVQVIKNLSLINKGDYLTDNFPGLESVLKNKSLIDSFFGKGPSIADKAIDLKKEFTIFISQYKFFLPFEIVEDSAKKTVFVVGKIKGTPKSITAQVEIDNVKLSFIYDNMFKITSVQVPGNKQMTDGLNALINANPGFNLNQLYEKALDFAVLKGANKQDICVLLGKQNNPINGVQIVECDKSHFKLTKDKVDYLFRYDEIKFISYDVTNERIKQKMSKSFTGVILNENLVKLAVDWVASVQQSELTGAVAAVPYHIQSFINDKFTNYLGTKISKVKQNGKLYNVEFELGGKKMNANVNTGDNYRMTDLTIMHRPREKAPYNYFLFSGFNLKLIDSNKLELNVLKEKTDEYLNKLDPKMFEKYSTYIKNVR